MFQDIHEIAVLVSAILAIAVGSIWYSPLVFGETWMRVSGVRITDFPPSKRAIFGSVVSALVGNIVALFVLAQFVALARMYGISIWYLASLLLVLFGASLASMALWEKKTFTYVAIHVGYIAIVIYGGVTIISMWPW